ncbi:IS4 family transposase [Pontiellaceae bacterium B12227]|nr:IS4 family transposase [Pontiellaceae bacterium B12227]
MYSGTTVFSQLMQQLPWWRFQTFVDRYQGDYKVKTFRCAEHFRVMAFAQLTYRESLRDIEACLRAMEPKLYHMGIHSTVSRNNLSNANENRDWRIYAEFAQVLIQQARALYVDDSTFPDLDATVYALDSSTIDLCMTLFPWAHFRRTKSAVKMHTLLNLCGNIPEYILITEANVHDVNVLDHIIPLPGAYYVMDRAYLDFERLLRLHSLKAYFVTRAKKNFQFQRRYSHPADRSTGIVCDQTVLLTGFYPKLRYREALRRIKYRDPEGRVLVFLTNDFSLPALTIAELYKARWQIELFFKWIKQHLRIKAFFGTSANAVKTQIWIAVCVYLLIAITKKRLKIEQSLYTILQILSVSVFEKVPLLQAFQDGECKINGNDFCNQLQLFD